jgi:hypothetical protein
MNSWILIRRSCVLKASPRRSDAVMHPIGRDTPSQAASDEDLPMAPIQRGPPSIQPSG